MRNVRSSMECVSSSIASSASIDALGGREVAVEQRLRAAGDRLGGERGETDHVDAQLVEVLVVRPADLLQLALGERSRGHVVSGFVADASNHQFAPSRQLYTRGSRLRHQDFLTRSPARYVEATPSKQRVRSMGSHRSGTARRSTPPTGPAAGRIGQAWSSVGFRAWPGGQRRSVWGRELPPSRAPHPPHLGPHRLGPHRLRR